MDILDASALLAYLKKEKGYEKVRDIMMTNEKLKLSTFVHQVNFIETIYRCVTFFGAHKTQKIIADLKSPFFGVVNYMDTDLALYVSNLKAAYQLSLADAVGLAYCKIIKGTFWTADKALRPIAEQEGIQLELIR